MRRIAATLSLGLLVVGTLPAAAQTNQQGAIAEMILVQPLPGHRQAFEAGIKKYVQWNMSQHNTWSWGAAQIIVGPRTGDYVFASFGHNWADFDKPGVDPAASHAFVDANLAPHTASSRVSMLLERKDLSLENPNAPQATMVEVYSFQVKSGQDKQFEHFVTAVGEAFKKQNIPASYTVYELMVGGEGSEYAVVIPHENWASFGGGGPLDQLLEQAFGRFQAEQLGHMIDGAVASSRSEVFALRPDLSLNWPPR